MKKLSNLNKIFALNSLKQTNGKNNLNTINDSSSDYDLSDIEDKDNIKYLEGEEYEMALLGPDGLKKFRDLYRKRRRMDEFRLQDKKNPTAAHAYLSKMENMKMIPRTLGLVKQTGSKGEINLGNYAIGDKCADAFSAAMSRLTQIESIDLSKNSLSDKGAIGLIENSPMQLKKLNLSCNRISIPTYKVLGNLLRQSGRSLREIVLDSNKAGDSGAALIAQALDSNYTVAFLSLRYKRLYNNIVRMK